MSKPTMPNFRQATADDLPTLVALLADDELGQTREAPSDPVSPAYQDAFDAILADPRHAIWLAVTGSDILGLLQLSFIPGLSHQGAWRAQIEGVRVARTARGEGIGHALLVHAMSEAETFGCRLIQLTTDTERVAARRFYESLGFTASHHGMKRVLDGPPS